MCTKSLPLTVLEMPHHIRNTFVCLPTLYSCTISLYYVHYSVTSDVLSITTEREENILFIKCYFISGSDALGCKVVIVNYNPYVKNVTGFLMRKGSDQFAEGQFILNHSNESCFHQVFAFDIETDNTISDLAIEGFVPLFIESIQCTQCVEKGIQYLI